jgi:membrane fusion protein, multidrug efflux system
MKQNRLPLVLAGATLLVLVAGGALLHRAKGATNQVALASKPKGVTVARAEAARFRSVHKYVGTVVPWLSARIGPQLTAAYVDTVLVRPGALVKRGAVIATLDCRNADAAARAIQQQARSVARTQEAVAAEAARMSGLLDKGFVSADELEMKRAESESKDAQRRSLEAQAAGSGLQVQDCILRAPFDGEIIDRLVDPGAFVRPGAAVATLVDRHVVRVVADVPEQDFEAVAPGAKVQIHLLAVNRDMTGIVSRRSPGADPETRTVHFEIDLPNDEKEKLPVGTTAELRIEAGSAMEATLIPLSAATIHGEKASLFIADGEIARQKVLPVLGEREGMLYVDPSLAAGAMVVTQGRGALEDGDHIEARP